MTTTSTLVIGLGNPLLGDDSVGWRVAEQVREVVANAALPVEVDCLAVGGLSLMERLIDCESVILIDAIATGQQPSGSVTCFLLDDLPDFAAGHLNSAHDVTLQTALQVGRTLGVSLPDIIRVVAVEIEPTYDVTDVLTPLIAAAVPHAVHRVMEMLTFQERTMDHDFS